MTMYCVKANMSVHKFQMMSKQLFLKCSVLHCIQPICGYSKAKKKKLQVANNDALRILFKVTELENIVTNYGPTYNLYALYLLKP